MFLSQQNAEHCIEAIDTGLKGVETQLDSLARQIAVLDDEWNGEAKEAFAEAMSEWTATVVEMRRIAAEATRVAAGSVTRIGDFDGRRASAWAL
jgi:WXG100 family type VII secretion target